MNHHQKIEAMRAHLAAEGLKEGEYAPPVYRLLWKYGVEATPPLFASFRSIAFYQGTFFGVFWGLMMLLLSWRRGQPWPIWLAILLSLFAGALFGCLMAYVMRRKAEKLGLPLWSEYTGSRVA